MSGANDIESEARKVQAVVFEIMRGLESMGDTAKAESEDALSRISILSEVFSAKAAELYEHLVEARMLSVPARVSLFVDT